MDPADLKSIPLFASLSARDREQLARSMDLVELPAGKSLAQEGVLAYEFQVIKTGTAEVAIEGEHVRDLGAGDYVGEIGLLQEDRRRTASVTTTSPMVAIVMTGPEFRAMVRDLPAVAEDIYRTIQARLAEAEDTDSASRG